MPHVERTYTDHLSNHIVDLVDQTVINHSTADLLKKLIKGFYFTYANCMKEKL